MSDLITIEYSLTVERQQERLGDEPRLEFVFVTNIGNTVQVQSVDTGILAEDFPGRRISAHGSATMFGLQVHVPIAPTPENNFLGFAVRAYETDGTDTDLRRELRDNMHATVAAALEPTLQRGRKPTAGQIWTAVNGSNTIRVDERTGVSARVFPELGIDVVRDGERRSYVPTGGQADDEFLFQAAGARWRMPFEVFHQSFA